MRTSTNIRTRVYRIARQSIGTHTMCQNTRKNARTHTCKEPNAHLPSFTTFATTPCHDTISHSTPKAWSRVPSTPGGGVATIEAAQVFLVLLRALRGSHCWHEDALQLTQREPVTLYGRLNATSQVSGDSFPRSLQINKMSFICCGDCTLSSICATSTTMHAEAPNNTRPCKSPRAVANTHGPTIYAPAPERQRPSEADKFNFGVTATSPLDKVLKSRKPMSMQWPRVQPQRLVAHSTEDDNLDKRSLRTFLTLHVARSAKS